MNITVNIDYRTAWGERVVLILADGKRVDMSCSGSNWVAMFTMPKSAKSLSYRFELLNDKEQTIRTEWGEGHNYAIASDAKYLVIEDCWSERPANRTFYTSMFTDTIFAHDVEKISPLAAGGLRLEVEAPTLRRGESLALIYSDGRVGAEPHQRDGLHRQYRLGCKPRPH